MVGFAFKGVHRKPLMVQRFLYPRVDMPTKIRDRGIRRDIQHQRHNPGDHPGERLRLRTSPADREVEHHLGPSAHRPRTKSAHAAVMTDERGMFHASDNSGPGEGPQGPIEPASANRIVPIDRLRRPRIRPAFRWKVPAQYA